MYLSSFATRFITALVTALVSVPALLAQQADQLTTADLSNAKPKFHLNKTQVSAASVKAYKNSYAASAARNAGVTGIDSVVNFTGSFAAAGYDPNGIPQSKWFYSMVGAPPAKGDTTVIKAPLIPVSVLLLNSDGTPRYVGGQLLYSDASQFVEPTLQSPVFQNYSYSSSNVPTQYTDAIQRAEFIHREEEDWHTLLAPSVKPGQVLLLPYGSYRFALNADGTCCRYILADANVFSNLLFPPTYPVDGTTILGAAELSGQITTKDISTLLLPNVFLYENADPNQCCVLGFHSIDSEPGESLNGNTPRLYVMDYASWISPGLFGEFQDVTALSHELSEIFNDPFVGFDNVHNVTPWWLAPNGNCQDDLETGDVVEGLPNAVYPITMNGATYHPQNVALLEWFAFQSTSKALKHAYSYPDTSVLTALSPVEKKSCQ